MPLSIGTVASHYSIVDPFDAYDYAANKLSYTPITNTWGVTSGMFYGNRERCRFNVDEGYWYSIVVSATSVNGAMVEWSLDNYMANILNYSGIHVGNNTCDFGACPTPGNPVDSVGKFYFFAQESTLSASFFLGRPSHIGSSQQSGLFEVQLFKSDTHWTRLTSASGFTIDYPTRLNPKKLVTFSTTDTTKPFLIQMKTVPFTEHTINSTTVLAGLDEESLITLPRMPAVFEYNDQLHSGTWTLSGFTDRFSSRTVDIFVYTKD